MVIFFVITNIFVLFLIVCACVCMCGMQKNREEEKSGEEGREYTHECNRQELALLELVLQVVVSHPKWMVDVGNQTHVFFKSSECS